MGCMIWYRKYRIYRFYRSRELVSIHTYGPTGKLYDAVSSILKQLKIVITYTHSLWVDAARGLHDMVGDMFYSLIMVYIIY